MSNPTIVFSIGAWITPPIFDAVRDRLNSLGFASECPAHPSIGAEPPTKTLADDVAALREVLTVHADEGRELVVVAHSYGGVVASVAVEGLALAARKEQGKSGSVTKVIYMAAFALDKGQSLLGMLRGNYLPWMQVDGDYVYAAGAAEIAWHGIPLEKQEKWAVTTLHTSRAVFSGEATYEPWRDIPCAYIICEQDRTLPPFQELFASKVAGPETTYRLPSSHSRF